MYINHSRLRSQNRAFFGNSQEDPTDEGQFPETMVGATGLEPVTSCV